MPTRESVVGEARSWLGTRFHHQGRMKRTADHAGGCDCIGLILGVMHATECKLNNGHELNKIDRQDYSREPNGQQLKDEMDRYLIPVDASEVQPADIGLFKFEQEPQHVAFFSNYQEHLGLIHCYMQAKKVVEHDYSPLWQKRLIQVYCIPQIGTVARQ